MALPQSSNVNKPTKLPNDILERSDRDVVDCVLGKRIRRELQKEAETVKKTEFSEDMEAP